MRRVLLAIVFSIFAVSIASAAPVRLPSDAGKTEAVLGEIAGGKVLVGVGAEYEHIDEIDLDHQDSVEADSAAGLISFTYDKKASIYGTFGQFLDPKYSDETGYIDFDDSNVWGAGLNAIVFENEACQVFADANYRKADDMDIESAVVGSTVLTKSQIESSGLSVKGEVEEWQIASGVAKDFSWGKPYAGVKYLNSEFTGKASFGGSTVEGTSENDNRVGVFLGALVAPVKGLELNVQGRFVDETAVMGNVTFKF